jgi:SAM-dependent methyltransferase
LDDAEVREEEIVSGWLVAADGHRYAVEDGIPNLVIGLDFETGRTGEQFAFEFTQVGDVEDRESKFHRDITLFAAKTGIDPSFLEVADFDWRLDQDSRAIGYSPDFSFLNGKTVVDAGCGNGRFAKIAAAEADQTILLDLGAQIYKARDETRGAGHVHFIRCNLLHVPLAPKSVDFAYSIGVLHHTADPAEAFAQVSQTVKEGGVLSVWMYPPQYWGHPIKAAVSKAIRRHLLSLQLPAQISFIRRWLMPLGRFQMHLASSRALKVAFAPLFLVNVPRHEDRNEMEATVIDYYLPEFINTYLDSDMKSLFERNGFDYRRLGFPTAGTGVRRG